MDIQKNRTLFFNTVHKEYRSRTLIFLFVITLLLILGINGVINTFAENAEMIAANKLQILYRIISAWGGILGVLFGCGCVQSDYENNVLPQLLAFPIRRTEYLGARVLGTWFIVICYYLVSLVLGLVLFSFSSTGVAIDHHILPSLLVNGLAILATILLGLFFSLFMHKLPAFIAGITTSLFITLANLSLGGMTWEQIFESVDFPRAMGILLHGLLPRIGTLNTMARAILLDRPLGVNPWIELGHFTLTTTLLCLIIHTIFRRKEI